MKFIYCGSVEVHEKDVEMVLAGAKTLKLHGFYDDNEKSAKDYNGDNNKENDNDIKPKYDERKSDGNQKSVDRETNSYQDAFEMKLETGVDDDKKLGDCIRQYRKQFRCDVCDLSYSSQGALLNHKRGIHQGIVYNCDYDGCGFSANQAGNLKQHIVKKHARRSELMK